jgi:predicted HAD superfamily Cof-like phosphohydrolase
MSDFRDVGSFHHKFGLDHVDCDPYDQSEEERLLGCMGAPVGPREVPRELLEFRLKFLLEELLEFAETHNYILTYDAKDERHHFIRNPGFENEPTDHAKAFDSLIDLAYVTFGTAHVFGYPWSEGWNEVQRANMAKERCVNAQHSTRGSNYDVIKPAGWKAPDIAGILRRFGWKT